MLISLCAIVRDDELLVRRMLESVVDLVDEIVIADTGSKDGTVERIEELSRNHTVPVRLLRYEWQKDFAKARNYTLDHAEGDWIIFLDADETLGSCDIQQVRHMLETTSHDGFFVKVRNYGGSMLDIGVEVDVDSIRVFRRKYRFEGAIHEQIGSAIVRGGGTVGQLPMIIHHIGYLWEYRELKGKNERNLEILERQVAAIPTSHKQERWFAQCNLLQEYQVAGRWDELASKGRLLLEELLRTSASRRPPYTKRVFRQCITGLRNSNRWDEAVRVAEEYTRVYAKDTEAWYWLAETCMGSQRYADAIRLFKKCRDMGEVSFDTQEYVAGTGSYLAAKGIGLCWVWLGDDVSARDWLLTSWEEQRHQAGLLSWLGALIPDPDFWREMKSWVTTPQRYSEYLLVCASNGHEDTPEYIREARQRWGDLDFIRRAELAFQVAAQEALRMPADLTPRDHIRLGFLSYHRGDIELAQHHWAQAGPLGRPLIELDTGISGRWSVATWLPELVATRADTFLARHAVGADDFAHYLPYICHTTLRGVLDRAECTTPHARNHYEWEERALRALRNGDIAGARHCVEKARLPGGALSVRGYLIMGDSERERIPEIIVEALQHYPSSRLLQSVGRTVLSRLTRTSTSS